MDDESRKRQFDDFAGDSQESNHDTKEDDYSSSESDEEPLPPVPTAPRHFPEGESNRSVASREPTPKGGEESLENSQYEEGEEIEEEPTPGSRKFHGCSALAEYSVTEKIGEGTFGEVSIGRHKKSGDVVALKKILVHNEKEGIPVTALREIRILKALAHPNIIALKEIAYRKGDRAKKEKGVISMVFPYLDHDLTGLLENPAVRFKPPHIKSYMKQLLMGTNYLHKSHILHRDIKGSNILVDNKGNLKIADFGLARSYTAEDKKKYTNMVVTRWYRPPELLMGAVHYTTAIDIWGVGCVFGELLKRRPILPGSSDLDQLQKIFQLCGTPTDENWPDYKQLPNIANQSITLPFPEIHGRNIRTKFSKSHFHRTTVDLLDELLRLDPSVRPTAGHALDHQYFFIPPTPARPNTSDFEIFPTSHELSSRNAKNERIGTHLANHHDAHIGGRSPRGRRPSVDRRDRPRMSNSRRDSPSRDRRYGSNR